MNTAIELTVPCVAAHLLAAGVLRFLPTDADTECERCGGIGWVAPSGRLLSKRRRCPDCTNGRRPLRAGDRIAIRADDDVPNAPASLDPWCLTVWRDLFGFRRYSLFKRLSLTDIPLRPGEVVGHLTVTNVLPIVDACRVAPPYPDDGLYVCTCGEHEGLWLDSDWPTDLSDHVDAGLVFTPGQIALELAAGADR